MKAKLIHIIIPIIVAALSVLGWSQLKGVEGIAFKFDVAYNGDSDALWVALDTFSDGTVVVITFGADGLVLQHTDKLQLMGGSGAAFDIGDRLPLDKTDGVWREMTRYLKP